MKAKRNYLLSFYLTIFAIPLLLFVWSCEKEDPVQPATLNTLSVNNITINTAQSGGNITSDGGGDITSRGAVWSTSSNPTVEQNNGITMEGSGPGLFQSNITGLQSNTTYYLRAYATNEAGIVYGNEQQFTTMEEEPELFIISGTVVNAAGIPVPGAAVSLSNLKTGNVTKELALAEEAPLHMARESAQQLINEETNIGENIMLPGRIKKTPNLWDYNPGSYVFSGYGQIVNQKINEQNNTTNTVYDLKKGLDTKNLFTTDSDGNFRFTELEGGSYVISVEIDDYHAFQDDVIIEGSNVQKNISLVSVVLPQVSTLNLSSGNNSVIANWQSINKPTLKGYNNYAQHFFWHNGSWEEDADYIYPDYSGWYKTNSAIITGNSIQYEGYEYNSAYGGKVFAVNIDNEQTAETSATIKRHLKLPVKRNVITSFSLTSGTSAVYIPDSDHEISVHLRYFYTEVVQLFSLNGWKLQVSTNQNNWTTLGEHNIPSGLYSPDNFGKVKTFSLNQYKGQTIYFRTDPSTFSGDGPSLNVQNMVVEYSMDGSDFGGSTTLAQVSTSIITNITQNSATGGGNVTDDGGAEVTERGIAYSTSQNPTTSDNTVKSGIGTGSFTSNLTGLTDNTTYYVRAYAINSEGTGYGSQIQFITDLSVQAPDVTTSNITNISENSANGGGDVTNDGGAAVTARGIVWSTSQNPTIDSNSGSTIDGSGTGSFTSSITGLSLNATYYVRAYATNAVGTEYGVQVSFITIGTHNGTGVLEVTNPITGQIWMDRNLGASRAAASSTDSEAYGDLYQWGRAADGHEKRNSNTTFTFSSSNTPGHGNFIVNDSSPYDWRSPQNNNLWQGVNGTNNPCPSGFRLPTEAELDAERQSWSYNNAAGAFASPLKLPVAGGRGGNHGSLYNVGSGGPYWSSTVVGPYSRGLYFSSSDAYMNSSDRARGRSVRCLKD